MISLTYHSDYNSLILQQANKSIFSRFYTWTKQEEKNHIAWVGISITVMTAVFFPITMAAILFNGAVFKLIIGAMISLSMVVIANLASLPTKYTIPAFLAGIVMDVGLIIISFII
jgi:hypothetical protein